MISLHFPLRSAFLALPLDEESRKQFAEFQERLMSFSDSLTFQSPKTPHITLQFWQELLDIEYHQVIRQATKIAAASHAFDLRLTETGTFGHRGRDNVLFLAVPFSEELAWVKKRCPWPAAKPFHPHVTVARIRHPERFSVHKKRILKALDAIRVDMHVDRLGLYATVEGKKQTLLQEFSFSS